MNQVKRPHPAASGKPLRPSGKPERPGASAKRRVAGRASEPDRPTERAELIRRVKAEIDAGTYETPERLDIAIRRLLKDLNND